jgi:hypothetical protein
MNLKTCLGCKTEYTDLDSKRFGSVFEEFLNPEVLKKFKKRLQEELEEIAYLKWRAMQPEWKTEIAKAESDPMSKAALGGFVGTQAGATALGVFAGTTAMRVQLNEIKENQGEGSSTDTGAAEGGILDSLGEFF